MLWAEIRYHTTRRQVLFPHDVNVMIHVKSMLVQCLKPMWGQLGTYNHCCACPELPYFPGHSSLHCTRSFTTYPSLESWPLCIKHDTLHIIQFITSRMKDAAYLPSTFIFSQGVKNGVPGNVPFYFHGHIWPGITLGRQTIPTLIILPPIIAWQSYQLV